MPGDDAEAVRAPPTWLRRLSLHMIIVAWSLPDAQIQVSIDVFWGLMVKIFPLYSFSVQILK